MHLVRVLGPVPRPLLPRLARTGLLRLLARPLSRHPARVDRTVSDALAYEIRPASFLAAARAARTHDDAVWRRVACPVRVVRGRHDVFVAARDGQRWRRLIRDRDEIGLDASGHFVHAEQPVPRLLCVPQVWTYTE